MRQAFCLRKPSLRANRSRECSPDDRLREAIQLPSATTKLDCFVAALLAMTGGKSVVLQKTLRVDIDLELEIAFCLWTCGEPFAQVFGQVDVAQRLHQQAEAIASLDHGERCFGRSQHLDALVERGNRCKLARKSFGGRPVAGGDDQARQPPERRI